MKRKLTILITSFLANIGLLFATETATINIRYENGGLDWKQFIECNDVLIGTMNKKNCISIRVPVGNVQIKTYYPPFDISGIVAKVSNKTYEQLKEENNNVQFLNLYVQPGEVYYIKIEAQSITYPVLVLEDARAAKKYKVQNILDWASLARNNPVSNNFEEKNVNDDKIEKNVNNHVVHVVQSDVDFNIPESKKAAENTFALIIANEDYQFVDPVNFASHDGEVFKEYCIKTLGIPEKQVRYCSNATYGVISGGVDWLSYALNNFQGSRAIVYYCGHGIPDEKTGEAYIIPVDGKGTNTATCYSLNQLYKTLSNTKAANVTYFMDACFTGANKEGSMLVAARGVAREPKKESIDGNTVVFSASSGDETAMTYEEKGHGLFTYYLLKKLQETGGDVSYYELAAYINRNVKKDAFLLNEKPQTPVVAVSQDAVPTWKGMKLK